MKKILWIFCLMFFLIWFAFHNKPSQYQQNDYQVATKAKKKSTNIKILAGKWYYKNNILTLNGKGYCLVNKKVFPPYNIQVVFNIIGKGKLEIRLGEKLLLAISQKRIELAELQKKRSRNRLWIVVVCIETEKRQNKGKRVLKLTRKKNKLIAVINRKYKLKYMTPFSSYEEKGVIIGSQYSNKQVIKIFDIKVKVD